MKNLIILIFLIIAVKVYSADDYKYCNKMMSMPVGGGYGGNNFPEGYPFKIEDDGNIRPHSSVNMATNNENRTVTITIPSPAQGMPPQTIEIKKDENGKISKFVSNLNMKAPETSSGLGTNNAFGNPYGYIGAMSPMYGFGAPMQDSQISSVIDVKFVNGKCFPYRTVSATRTGGHTHRAFVNEVALCRDLNQFNSQSRDSTSRISQLKTCYDEYQKEAQKIIDGHLERNDDLYNPPSNETAQQEYPGLFNGEGSFGSGMPAGQYGYGNFGAGGFGMSIDNIVNNRMFDSSQKQAMLYAYCQYGLISEMSLDDSLFPTAASTPSESGAAATRNE